MSAPRTLVSGGTGFVGRFIVEALLNAGHEVAVMGRTAPPPGLFSGAVGFAEGALDPERDQRAAFEGIDNLVHAAFDHLPGRYRGGEGDDPEGFRRRNLDGSVALFEAARAQGVARAVLLSSRAVYGARPSGAELAEETQPHPDTLYGAIKLAAEDHLARMIGEGWAGGSLRITGIYGPAGQGREHKWSALFRDYLTGKPIEPRAGTEVHGADVGEAVRLMLTVEGERLRADNEGAPTGSCAFNVSDLIVDRRDLLAIVKEATGCRHPLPARADTASLNVMRTEKLRRLGWRPGGAALLAETVRALAAEVGQDP